MRNIWLGFGSATLALGAIGAVAVSAQQGPPRGEARQGGAQPSEAMLQACSAKKAEDSCSVSGEDGGQTPGTCRAPQGRPLACVPDGGGQGGGRGPGGRGGAGGGGGPPPDQSNSGSKISETQAYTLGVLCGLSDNKLNPQIGLISRYRWSCERGQRSLISNGIPNHSVGQFPNPANPNTISEQQVTFTASLSPIAYTGPGGRTKEGVMGINGIKFDPGTGGSCNDDISDAGECPLGPGGGGRWHIEALGQDTFDFGTDMNHAHVQPGGMYHYHGVPDGMLSQAALSGKQMALIGWAVDGFPVYARYGHPGSGFLMSQLRLMKPSYRLKKIADPGRPSAAIVPMGAFAQDWEYVAGLGDLDECNGRFGSTPEFPEGIYHYFATDGYPYIQRCVKGSAEVVREPPAEGQPGGRREGGRGRGEGGQGGGQRGGQRGPGGQSQ